MLVCLSCKKEFEESKLDFVRCPNCDSKILFKSTPPVVHKTKAY